VHQIGSPDHDHPGCLNYSFAYVEGKLLLVPFQEYRWIVPQRVHVRCVLRALGVGDQLAHSPEIDVVPDQSAVGAGDRCLWCRG